MYAVILCGGLGTRIRTITQDSFPKAMIKIQGLTILEWELHWLRKYNIENVILAVRHLANYIQENIGEKYKTEYGVVNILYSREPEKLGSGGAISFGKNKIKSEDFIIMNGDIMTNFPLDKMIADYKEQDKKGSVAVAKMQSPYGIVEFDDNAIINRFREKPLLNHWIHAGVDIFAHETLKLFPDKGQMEDTVFIDLAEKKNLLAYQIDPGYYWRSIDTSKDFKKAEEEWPGLEI